MDTSGNQGSVILEPKDVPGAVLRQDKSVEDCTNLELQRWLECRGLKKNGNKSELVERVINCINAGRENNIFLGVDGGKWYDAKRNLMMNLPATATATPLITLSWRKFPSGSIPNYFNKGHIYTHIAGIQFESEDYEAPDSEGSVTEKPFRRGSQFVSSDHIHDIYDAKDSRYYYLKAKCLASFRAKIAYNVKCTLNLMSGAVVSGECERKQSALSRCSHVAAILLFLSKFTEENGYDGTACTSKLQEWGLGAKNKTPGPVASQNYPTVRFDPLKRALFDPRPTNYARDEVNLNNFICDIQNGRNITMYETVLKLKYEDFQMAEMDVEIIKQQVKIFETNMTAYMNSYHNKVFPIKGAEAQGSVDWKKWRSYFFTASNTKTASSLMSTSAKSIYLKKNLWQLTPSYAMLPAFLYGRNHEPSARNKYKLNNLGINDELIEVGLCANKDYPHLACSVDGLVLLNGNVKRIIEIKCPKILENANPCDFSRVLTKEQKGSFCLEEQKGSFCLEEKNGKIKLKDNHPYLYQVVTSMLIFEVTECDFIVWSKVNMLVFKVQMENVNKNVIEDLLVKLKKMYCNMYIPELFVMKIPRNLPLLELDL